MDKESRSIFEFRDENPPLFSKSKLFPTWLRPVANAFYIGIPYGDFIPPNLWDLYLSKPFGAESISSTSKFIDLLLWLPPAIRKSNLELY